MYVHKHKLNVVKRRRNDDIAVIKVVTVQFHSESLSRMDSGVE